MSKAASKAGSERMMYSVTKTGMTFPDHGSTHGAGASSPASTPKGVLKKATA
jgi:hypothetical protein